jgi:hypothetical protein
VISDSPRCCARRLTGRSAAPTAPGSSAAPAGSAGTPRRWSRRCPGLVPICRSTMSTCGCATGWPARRASAAPRPAPTARRARGSRASRRKDCRRCLHGR